MKEINRNYPHCDEFSEESFLSILHESRIWDHGKYFKLENSLYEVANSYQDSDVYPKIIVGRVARIFGCIMLNISSHYNEKDLFNIKNLDTDSLGDITQRIQSVFESFFTGDMIDTIGWDYDVNSHGNSR